VSWYSQSAERCGGGFLAGISAVTAGAPETPAMNLIVAGSLMCIISEGMSNSPIGRATHSMTMRAASISTFLFCAWSVEAPHALHLQESGIGQESLNLNLNFRLTLPKQQTLGTVYTHWGVILGVRAQGVALSPRKVGGTNPKGQTNPKLSQ
jgi:hypothetical protein